MSTGHGRRLARRMVALLCIGFGWLTRLMPLRLARALAVGLAVVAYVAVPRIRRVGMANLDAAYGEILSVREKRRILWGAVRNAAMVAAEFSHIPTLAGGGDERLVRVEGLEHVDLSKGLIGIGAHLGNWEWMAPAMAAHGCHVTAVVRPLDDPVLNRYVDGVRRAGDVDTLDKDAAAQALVRVLREGGKAGLLVDQSPRENGVPATFFGRSCWATAGPALVARRARVPVHPVCMVRGAHGGYTLRFSPEVALEKTQHLRRDLQVNSQRFQDAIEEMVRAHPEQWLWFHRRWKPRPRLRTMWEEHLGRERPKEQETAVEHDL
ncbi:MAG: lysophospholipid acyltransferase family protein [Candidatus Hydrogenedentota bacterium]